MVVQLRHSTELAIEVGVRAERAKVPFLANIDGFFLGVLFARLKLSKYFFGNRNISYVLFFVFHLSSFNFNKSSCFLNLIYYFLLINRAL